MKLTDAFIQVLCSIAGSGNVNMEEGHLEMYGRDYTEDLFYAPSCVVMPETAETVADSGIYTRGRHRPERWKPAGKWRSCTQHRKTQSNTANR